MDKSGLARAIRNRARVARENLRTYILYTYIYTHLAFVQIEDKDNIYLHTYVLYINV